MNKKLRTEELIRQKLGEEQLSPSADAWKAIQKEVGRKLFFRFTPGRMNIYYSAAILLTLGGLTLGLLQDGGDNTIEARQVAEQKEQSGSTPDREIVEEKVPDGEAQQQEALNPESNENRKEAGEEAMQQAEESGRDPQLAVSPAPSNGQVPAGLQPAKLNGSLQEAPSTSEVKSDRIAATFSSSGIRVNASYGCVPLEVQFNSPLVDEDSEWDFGDGTRKKAISPIHTYTEAGLYDVVLLDRNGTPVAMHQVEAYPAPVADFDIDEGFEGEADHVILNLLNYSSDASTYDWCMVDEHGMNCSRWSSEELQPSVELNRIAPESRAIRLQAINDHGCRDSAFVLLPLEVESSEVRVKFPSAFSPNPSGPGDGTFHPGSRRIDVFHPLYVEVPAEMELRIFNRRGELLYQSKELYTGWNGYRNGSPAESDVYIWMAEGRWADGESFTYRGDVTLIWNQYF